MLASPLSSTISLLCPFSATLNEEATGDTPFHLLTCTSCSRFKMMPVINGLLTLYFFRSFKLISNLSQRFRQVDL